VDKRCLHVHILPLDNTTNIALAPPGGSSAMSRDLEYLIERARKVRMSPQEKEEQRRSFAYGNTKIENPRITREIIDQEAEKLARTNER
jgi:hypothetical protein